MSILTDIVYNYVAACVVLWKLIEFYAGSVCNNGLGFLVLAAGITIYRCACGIIRIKMVFRIVRAVIRSITAQRDIKIIVQAIIIAFVIPCLIDSNITGVKLIRDIKFFWQCSCTVCCFGSSINRSNILTSI